MKRRTMIRGLAGMFPALWVARYGNAAALPESSVPGERIAQGPFQPSWESLKQYQVPAGSGMQNSASRRIGGRNVSLNTVTGMPRHLFDTFCLQHINYQGPRSACSGYDDYQ